MTDRADLEAVALRAKHKSASKRALDLAPHLAEAHASRGLAVSLTGRFEDAARIFLLAPDWVGRELLGATWSNTSAVLWPMVLGQLAGNLAHGTSAAFVGMDRAKVSMGLEALFGAPSLIGGVGGAMLHGAVGAAWGFAIPFWLLLPVWWAVLLREIKRITAAPSET